MTLEISFRTNLLKYILNHFNHFRLSGNFSYPHTFTLKVSNAIRILHLF